MLKVGEWAEIRRLHKIEGLSQRAISRRLGVNRRTVAKALASPEPPGYQRSARGSILDPYKPKIHALLAEDPKLRAVRILELIRLHSINSRIAFYTYCHFIEIVLSI